MPGHGPPEVPPQKPSTVGVQQPVQALFWIKSPVVLTCALECDAKNSGNANANKNLLIRVIFFCYFMFRDTIWVCFPSLLSSSTNHTFERTRCTSMPHCIKDSTILTHRCDCCYLHTHII